MQISLSRYIYIYIYIYIYTYIYTHTHIHTHIHTYESESERERCVCDSLVRTGLKKRIHSTKGILFFYLGYASVSNILTKRKGHFLRKQTLYIYMIVTMNNSGGWFASVFYNLFQIEKKIIFCRF